MCSLAMPRDPPLPQPSAALWGGGGPGEGVGGHGLFTSKPVMVWLSSAELAGAALAS